MSLVWSLISQRGQLPPVTAPEGWSSPAIYSWRSNNGKRIRGALLALCDYYGNYFAHPSSSDLPQWDYLAASTEILLLLDPFDFDTNASIRESRGVKEHYPEYLQFQILQNIISAFRERRGIKATRKIGVPIACVIGKVDAFDEASSLIADVSLDSRGFDDAESRRVSDGMRALLCGWGGERFVRALETEFSTVRYFGVSALGSEPDYSTCRVASDAVRPSRVAEPLLWFLARRRVIPLSSRVRKARESA
ncbi:MAG: hypothetical protein ACOYEV_07415 [Candidatus Nanopelagicales bacterium]